MPRVALDVQFSRVDIERLTELGFEVVAWAAPGEPDRSWFARAILARAQMVCSPDTDIEILAYDHDIWFAKLPGSGRRGRQTDHVQFAIDAWWKFYRRAGWTSPR